jgi:hypothetical protein
MSEKLEYTGDWRKRKIKLADVPHGKNDDGTTKMEELMLDPATFPEKGPIIIEVPNQAAAEIVLTNYPNVFKRVEEPAPEQPTAESPTFQGHVQSQTFDLHSLNLEPGTEPPTERKKR